MEKELNTPKILNAWAFYDWANSVHSLTITSAIFPIYFPIAAIMAGNSNPAMLDIFGFELRNTVVYSYSISIAFLLLAGIVPFLSGIADYMGNKKTFMRFFLLPRILQLHRSFFLYIRQVLHRDLCFSFVDCWLGRKHRFL